jgi:hypothetical protein
VDLRKIEKTATKIGQNGEEKKGVYNLENKYRANGQTMRDCWKPDRLQAGRHEE